VADTSASIEITRLIAGTAENFVYRQNRAALVLLDYDTKGQPDAIKARIEGLGGFIVALSAVCADIARARNLSAAARPAPGARWRRELASGEAGRYRGGNCPGCGNAPIEACRKADGLRLVLDVT
jgi:hypothetical protein